MPTKREYEARHWKWIIKANFDYKKMSRKTKKALVRHFKEITDEYEKSDDYKLRDLPECEACWGVVKTILMTLDGDMQRIVGHVVEQVKSVGDTIIRVTRFRLSTI